MDKKQILEEVIRYLEHLSNSTGETITEYDWRECCGLISQLEQSFPEYNLDIFRIELYKSISSQAEDKSLEGSETT